MKTAVTAIPALLLSTSAFAHHPLNGLPMETALHGLASGFGHPLLGVDHLLFVVLVGVMASLTGRPLLAPLAYLAAMLGGCLLVSMGAVIPATELAVGLSLLIAGVIVLGGRSPTLLPALALFAAFGAFHGAAFGDSIATQEAAVGLPVLLGYLLGLAVIQYLIAVTSGWLIVAAREAQSPAALAPRLAGAMVAGGGLLLTFEQVEAPLLRAISG